ncbi:MAG: hypothetical protein KC418_23500 [Anaerolineales bacterium]|nr:hypothetical protein [Anaerolineales bacterium]
MTGLRPGELTGLQTTQAGHMMDTCVRLVYSSALDAYNIPQPTYTPGDTLACGFNPSPSKEMMNQVPDVEAVLRLPVGTTLDNRDRLRITYRFGVAVTNEDYEIAGQPRRGPSGLLVPLKKVTDGS